MVAIAMVISLMLMGGRDNGHDDWEGFGDGGVGLDKYVGDGNNDEGGNDNSDA